MTTEIKNKCTEVELMIDEYLEGMISLKDKESMDEHISGCKDCSEYFSSTKDLIKNLNSLQGKNVNLSVEQKNDLWERVDSKIDIDKHKKEKAIRSDEKNVIKEESFFSKYKYYVSGAAAVLVISIIAFALKNINLNELQQQSTLGLPTYWKVARVSGTPSIGNVAIQGTDSIKEGQFISTNDSSRAELIVANLGKVMIEPNSKVLFIKGEDGNNRIMVEYGTIDASMSAQPKAFFVEMPSSVVSDQNGDYRLTIDSSGDGLVFVKSGKVEVKSDNKEVIIPAGNIVMTKKDAGVGTPFNENSSPQFKRALYNFDFGNCNETCVNTLLNTAKMSDAVSLVNLIPRVEGEYKDDVYTKLVNFVPPPRPMHRDSIPFMNEDEINEWVDKIQIEVQENIERSMEEVEKNLENIKQFEFINPDTLKALEDFAKNYKFKIKTSPDGNYQWSEDSSFFDKEQFKKDMEEMQKDINENNKVDKQQFKEDMEQLKDDLEEMKKDIKENLNFNNEELKKEMDKVKEEIQKSLKGIEIYQVDSIKNRVKVKVNVNDEVPEPPEPPEEIDTDDK